MQSIATNGAHKVTKWTELNIMVMILFVHCNMLLKSDKACRVTSTSWTAISWIAWARIPDHLQGLLGATKCLTAL